MLNPHWLVNLDADERRVLQLARDAESSRRRLIAVRRASAGRVRSHMASSWALATSFVLGFMLGPGGTARSRDANRAQRGRRVDFGTLATLGLWLLRCRSSLNGHAASQMPAGSVGEGRPRPY